MQPLEGHLKDVLNHATIGDLVRHYGINQQLATKIIANRPYTSELEFLEKAAIPKRAYEQLRRHLQRDSQ
jgi:DNA uptake protein ComE-like DNA-binding protein